MVQRYEARRDYFGGWIDLPKGNQGRYVLYTDYAALEQRVKELEAMVKKFSEELDHDIKDSEFLHQKIETLEAENAELRRRLQTGGLDN